MGTQAQLLKKIKNKVEKTVNGKPDEPAQDPKENGSTSAGSTSASPASTATTASSSSAATSTSKEFAAAKYGTKLLSLRKGEQLVRDEFGLVTLPNGTDEISFVTRMGKDYYLYQNDKVSGSFEKPPVDKIKGYGAQGNGEDRGGSSKPDKYSKLNSKYQTELTIGGKKYGPFQMIMHLSVSPDQSKFFAIVMGVDSKYALVSPKGQTKLPALPIEWYISPNIEKCGIVLTEDQLNGKDDPATDINAVRYLLMNDGSKIGPLSDMFQSEKSITDNGLFLQKKNDDSRQLFVNGKPTLKFSSGINNIDGVMLNDAATSGALFDNGAMHFSDGTEIGYTVISPKLVKSEGKVLLNGFLTITRPVLCMLARKNYSIILIATIFLLSFVDDSPVDYRKEFGDDYKNAESVASKLRPLIQQYAKEFNEDPKLMEAIIFPELIRYSRWYDVFETGSLCGLYANIGREYADFSIGHFQMKPSFAESIENFLYSKRNERWVVSLGFSEDFTADDFSHRMARVRRLQDKEWQLRYLVAFIKCVRIRFSSEFKMTKEEELKFFATAYNAGWQLQSSTIKGLIEKKFFYTERFNPGTRYSYASIALFRFRQI
jgi:hypothetical protein